MTFLPHVRKNKTKTQKRKEAEKKDLNSGYKNQTFELGYRRCYNLAFPKLLFELEKEKKKKKKSERKREKKNMKNKDQIDHRSSKCSRSLKLKISNFHRRKLIYSL